MTLGGTYSELANHIQANSGEVAGIICFANTARMDTLCPSQKLIKTLKEKYGDTIRRELGIAPEALARPEAEYLSRFKTVDTFRARLARAKREARPSEGVGEAPPPSIGETVFAVAPKGQAALFGEAEPEFKLTPTEAPPAQKIALLKVGREGCHT